MKIRLLRTTDIDRLQSPIGFSLITRDKQIMVGRVRHIVPWKICRDGILSLFVTIKDLTRVTNARIPYSGRRLLSLTFNEFVMITNAGVTNPRYRLFFETPLIFEENERDGRQLLRFKSRGETITLIEVRINVPIDT